MGIYHYSSPLSISTYFLIFWLHHMAYKILVPCAGIKPVFPVLEVSPNHRTAREFPSFFKEGSLEKNALPLTFSVCLLFL